MITPEGYSKDPSLLPEGIVMTWGKDLIAEKGGLLSFIRHFERIMSTEESVWLQKCRNKPAYDNLLYVYIIVCNQVKYRMLYAGHHAGITTIHNGDGLSWSSSQTISWSRVVMGGPFVKAPGKIVRKGFQGFRYCTKLF